MQPVSLTTGHTMCNAPSSGAIRRRHTFSCALLDSQLYVSALPLSTDDNRPSSRKRFQSIINYMQWPVSQLKSGHGVWLIFLCQSGFPCKSLFVARVPWSSSRLLLCSIFFSQRSFTFRWFFFPRTPATTLKGAITAASFWRSLLQWG